MMDLNLYVIIGSAAVVILTIVWAVFKMKALQGNSYSRPKRGKPSRHTDNRRNEGRQNYNLEKKERELRKKEKDINHRKRVVEEQERVLAEKESEIQNLLKEESKKLSQIAGLSRDEAEKRFFDTLKKQLRSEVAELKSQMEEDARKTSSEEAAKIIDESVKKHGSDVPDLTFSVFMLPRQEIKSWVIGSSGRNIRTFESATGAKLVISQFSDAVIISARDKSKVKMAEVALEELIAYGKITPELILDKVAHLKDEYVEFFEKGSQEESLNY